MTTTTRDDLIVRRDELLVAAFNGALETLGSKDAPPTSKATATTNAIRLYEMLDAGKGADKEPSEMTLDELTASIARLKKLNTEDDE